MRTITVVVVGLMLCNVLLLGLLLWERSAPAVFPLAEAQTVARGGKYIAVTANFSSNEMCLYLIDETTDRMLLYAWDQSKRTLRRLAFADLREDFQKLDTVERSRTR